MPNACLVKEILQQIETALETIKYRFEPVESVNYFLDTKQGQEKLDSLCMLFIAIGESLKHIDKLTDRQLLVKYDSVDWKAIKGMRDILSHHYFDMNAEAIYNVCADEVDVLHDVISQMIVEM